jgi:hypothetical protein
MKKNEEKKLCRGLNHYAGPDWVILTIFSLLSFTSSAGQQSTLYTVMLYQQFVQSTLVSFAIEDQ